MTTATKIKTLQLTPRQLENRLAKARKQGYEDGLKRGRVQAISAMVSNRVAIYGEDVDKGEVIKRTVPANDEKAIVELLDIECGLT